MCNVRAAWAIDPWSATAARARSLSILNTQRMLPSSGIQSTLLLWISPGTVASMTRDEKSVSVRPPDGNEGRRTGGGTVHPVVAAVAGSACISASAVFVKLSGANAGTAAFLRCVLALFVLVPLAVRECRRVGARPLRYRMMDIGAGVLLGVDMVFWAAAVLTVGASVATVLLNIQVVFFPLLARLVSGTGLSGRFVLMTPLMLAGVALASGAIGHPQPGSNPVAGVTFGTAAGVAYAGYLFLMRLGGGRVHRLTGVHIDRRGRRDGCGDGRPVDGHRPQPGLGRLGLADRPGSCRPGPGLAADHHRPARPGPERRCRAVVAPAGHGIRPGRRHRRTPRAGPGLRLRSGDRGRLVQQPDSQALRWSTRKAPRPMTR